MREVASAVLKQNMGAREDETVLVVADDKSEDIALAFYGEAQSLGLEAMLIQMSERQSHGAEPPAPVAAAMRASNIVIAPTTKSLSHTRARQEACALGARVATMPGITRGVMERTLAVDYTGIAEMSVQLADMLSQARHARLVSPAGTELTLTLSDRKGIADTGLLTRPGDFGNLPAGEAFIAPLETAAEGWIVVDGSIAGIGLLHTPITMGVKAGQVVSIRGGEEAQRLQELLWPFGHQAYTVAELGIGTNPGATLSGNVLEDEKVRGTVHIALGNNAFMGGQVKVPVHLDGVLLHPTLYLDGRAVIENGRLLVDLR
ncbi:MAG: aminopeptidase [Bacillota bacterium]